MNRDKRETLHTWLIRLMFNGTSTQDSSIYAIPQGVAAPAVEDSQQGTTYTHVDTTVTMPAIETASVD